MPKPERLKIVSYLAPNMFEFYGAVAAYLGEALELGIEIAQGDRDPLDDPILLDDHLDMAFICGLPFIRHHRHSPHQLQAIAAPVMKASRYHQQPVYFSDVIVNAKSAIARFDDLAGTVLCFNDLGSNSGYNLLRQRLIQGNYPSNFFGKAIPSGSHQRSIQWIVDGLADCAAIDSTVLEQELRNSPELIHQLRVIESIGPCPMPPVVVAQHLGTEVIDQIQSALLQPDSTLRSTMERVAVQRYEAVKNEDYEAIATQFELALNAGYAQL